MLKTQTALNRLWHSRPLEAMDGHIAMDVHRPLTYGERLRIREAGDESFTLGPHVDGGSVERWEDEEYRKVYSNVLAGSWGNLTLGMQLIALRHAATCTTWAWACARFSDHFRDGCLSATVAKAEVH